MLQTLPYNPWLQLFAMVAIEVLYVGTTAWKYAAIKHFVKVSSLVYIIIQGTLMVVFLSLVFAMSFKGHKYGNESTKEVLDRNQWVYGENVCMVVITVAIIVEFLLFLFSLLVLIKTLAMMLLAMFIEIKNSDNTQNPFVKKLIKEMQGIQKNLALSRFERGVFFELAPCENQVFELG